MKITRTKLSHLRNEEHYQLLTEFKGLVMIYKPEVLDIQALFATFLVLYGQEGEALNKIIKSVFTQQLSEADLLRDNTMYAFRKSIKGFIDHFVAEKRKAAASIQVVLDRYKQMEVKPYDQQTASTNALLGELNGSLAPDIKILNQDEWVVEVKRTNDGFDTLMKSRDSQEAAKTALRMKQVRAEIDKCVSSMIDRLDALILINGETVYTPFVNELNQRIARFNTTMAIRKGRKTKDTKEEEETTTK
jgi:hypothetical protein